MLVELFNFITCDFCRFKTDVGVAGTLVPEPHKLMLGLDPKSQYSISIDSSTSSTGIVISDLKSKFPIYFMNIVRDKTVEMNYVDYTDHFQTLLHSLFSRRTESGANAFKYAEVESPFYNPKQGKETYMILKSQFDRIMKIASKGYQIIAFQTPPQRWKSWFLGPVKEAWGLKMNRSNKDEIKRYGVSLLQDYYHIKSSSELTGKLNSVIYRGFKHGDVWDAFGIDRFFFGTKYCEDETTGEVIINVGSEMLKSRKAVYYTTFFYNANDQEKNEENIKYVEDTYRRMFESNNKELGEVKRHKFIFCNDLSIQDNIKVMAEQISDGIYFTVTNLEISLFPELYNGNMMSEGKPIQRLRPNNKLLVAGYKLL